MIAYRVAIESDYRLIVESFLDSYRDAHAAGLIAMEDWHPVMGPQWRKLLARPGVVVHVAHHLGETDTIADVAGWIAVERDYEEMRSVQRGGRFVKRIVRSNLPLVHYVFVKLNYRREGIARGLFAAAGVDPSQPFNHSAKTGVISELASKTPHARFRPLIARHSKTTNP